MRYVDHSWAATVKKAGNRISAEVRTIAVAAVPAAVAVTNMASKSKAKVAAIKRMVTKRVASVRKSI